MIRAAGDFGGAFADPKAGPKADTQGETAGSGGPSLRQAHQINRPYAVQALTAKHCHGHLPRGEHYGELVLSGKNRAPGPARVSLKTTERSGTAKHNCSRLPVVDTK